MFKFVYETDSFAELFRLPAGALYSDECIIDIELCNDISPKWVYAEGKACVVGLLHEKLMTVYAAESEDDPQFRDEVWRVLQQKAKSTNLWAFNAPFEVAVLKTMFDGFEFPIKEIRTICGSGWSKDKCYAVLRSYGVLKGDKEIFDVFGGDGRKAVAEFREYQRTLDMQHLMNIVHHNMNCLMKEVLVYKHRDFYPKQFTLDKNGFEVRAKKTPGDFRCSAK